MNKGIITLEYIEKIMKRSEGKIKGIIEKSSIMLILVEYFSINLTIFLDSFLIKMNNSLMIFQKRKMKK